MCLQNTFFQWVAQNLSSKLQLCIGTCLIVTFGIYLILSYRSYTCKGHWVMAEGTVKQCKHTVYHFKCNYSRSSRSSRWGWILVILYVKYVCQILSRLWILSLQNQNRSHNPSTSSYYRCDSYISDTMIFIRVLWGSVCFCVFTFQSYCGG